MAGAGGQYPGALRTGDRALRINTWRAPVGVAENTQVLRYHGHVVARGRQGGAKVLGQAALASTFGAQNGNDGGFGHAPSVWQSC